MGLTSNFAAVYLAAPIGSTDSPASLSAFEKFVANCPDNAFQRGTYSLFQRVFSIIKAAPKLFVLGVCKYHIVLPCLILN